MKLPAYGRVRADSGQHRRIFLVAVALGILAFIPISVRLWQLMITDHGYYSDMALRNQSRTTPVTAHRGTVYDRNMNALAVSVNVENIYLDPRELQQTGADIPSVSQSLGELLDMDPEKIAKLAVDKRYRYQLLASRVEPEVAENVRSYMLEHSVSGIHLEPATKRVYPHGALASQVIGFTNASNTGSEGIEAAYNSYLEGSAGAVVTTRGNNEMDMPFSYEDFRSAQSGADVVLTLDTVVQECLEHQLEDAIDRYDVQNGAFGIVMEVDTGRILAMATLGGYDPNAYLEVADPETAEQLLQMQALYESYETGSESYLEGKAAYDQALYAAQLKQWRNRCISDGYEPGSTFKVLTMAAALDSGAITLNDSFHCSGSSHIPGRSQLLHCWRSTGHGSQLTPQALQNSCNIAFANIALRLGGERFYTYVKNFGVLEKTGIDLAGESKGVFFDKALVTDTDKWGTASLTSGSFGQTFKLTPLQLVRAVSAVVNGGVLMEPYLVSDVIDRDGNVLLHQEPTQIRRVISSQTSQTMCTLMRSVVTEGTAKNAAVAGYAIGGKTGTSEKIDVYDADGKPTLDKIVSFIGVAPMDDPQYIVLVALDTPSRQTGLYISGGVMAAPTVGAVMADILPYLGVAREPVETVTLADYTGLTAQEAAKQLKEQGITAVIRGNADTVTAQLPAPGDVIATDSQILLYYGDGPGDDPVSVPDFSGMNRAQAAQAAGELGLSIQSTGNPELSGVTVTYQSIPPGTQAEPGTVITLRFADTKAAD